LKCRGPIIIVGATQKTLIRLCLGHSVCELFLVSPLMVWLQDLRKTPAFPAAPLILASRNGPS
jgi:hypothetical protein